MTGMYPEVGADIVKQGKLTEETEEKLKEALGKFKESYLRKIGAATIQPDIEMAEAEEL